MNEPRRASLPRLTERIPLGEAQVSPFCVGMVEDPDTIAAAFEAGINFFFLTADMHWPRYEASRAGLAQLLTRVPRDQITVAAAAYVTQPEFCSTPFEEVVQAVRGLERLDVLIAGGAYQAELFNRLPIYRGHRERRFMGAHACGVSFHDRRAAADAITGGELDVAFLRYNAAHPGAQRDVFPRLTAAHLRPRARVFGFTSTAGHDPHPAVDDDVWIPDLTDHYRFALSRIGLDGLLCSPTRPSHIADLAAAMAEGPLSLDEESHLIELASRRRAP
ncbi:MAG: hypothetical protein H7138_26520 [Myxococcales bacterium]|nr:hypothetical protein [Myxococcales bacterium]